MFLGGSAGGMMDGLWEIWYLAVHILNERRWLGRSNSHIRRCQAKGWKVKTFGRN